MFDITTARQISYGPGNEQSVVVFQDRDSTQKNIWYMVPVPRIRTQNGQPAFSLTRYNTSADGVAGVCTFSVEVYTPEEAKEAAKQQIRGIEGWGQFTWIGGKTFLQFDLQGKLMSVESDPSLFGSNVADFQIQLKSAAEVSSFEEAFKAPGAVSPFLVTYDLVVLTQLLAAKATVTYKSAVAIEVAKTYKTTKDTWGNKSTVLASVHRDLQRSGAGEVSVTPGAGATDELVQRVRDWAYSTLETQVADAIEKASILCGSATDPVSYTNDFKTTYSEDAIIEWSTPVSRFLPRFDAAMWKKLYHKVENRQLVVTFQLLGYPYDSKGNLLLDRVTVQVKYPTRPTDNTFQLTPGTNNVTKTYVASGTDPFSVKYSYQYTVDFPGSPSYKSDWIEDDSTLVTFLPNQFGIRRVSFVGVNVPFDKNVDQVLIDFYENPPEGQHPKLQTQSMTENGVNVTFLSTYRVPIANTYVYRLRYLLKNSEIITVQPDQQFGRNNADVVQVLNPAPSITSLDLRALVSKGNGFLDVNINAEYVNPQNPPSAPLAHSWSGWVPPKKPAALYSAEPWTFDARPDPQTAYFRLNGQIIFGDGGLFAVSDLNLAYKSGPLILRDTEVIFNVTIFTDQIDWTAVKRVSVNLFQRTDENGKISSGDGSIMISRTLLTPLSELTLAERDEVLGSNSGLVNYSVLPPANGAKVLTLYYTLRKPRKAKTVVFYFNAEYAMKNGDRIELDNTEVNDRLQITLPARPQPSRGPEPGVVIQRFEVEVGSN